jgi:hypothetical protein
VERRRRQTDDLQALIAAAREERSALSAMLTQISDAQREAVAARQVARAGRPEGGRTTSKLG